ncbi:putative metalloprotease CJM1_0395 family protein [Pokkaliibacter sp. CJK22405]|uniref:putative metalloprotease CJM1_0395 family protein n=1 Tax=Pokkaliibacter sp. CJK22405 TaxID=3384615 RepID=UPI0039852152
MLITNGLSYQPYTTQTAATPAAASLTDVSVSQQVRATNENENPANNGRQDTSGNSSAFMRDQEGQIRSSERNQARNSSSSSSSASQASADSDAESKLVSSGEEQSVEDLKKRDQEVRAHEQAHASAAGKYGGSPQFEYTRGPDGRLYATSGEVSVDTSPIPNDPQETIEKAQAILKAARAPSEPSSQDNKVAMEAQRMMAEAQAELARDQSKTTRESDASSKAAMSDEVRSLEQTQERLVASNAGDNSSPVDTQGSVISAATSASAKAYSATAAAGSSVSANPSPRTEAFSITTASLASTESSASDSGAIRSPSDYQREQVESQLREANRKMVEMGIYTRLYPPGGFVNVSA